MIVKNCDCLEYSKLLPNDSFDLIYLDPPFFTQEIMKSSNNEYKFNDKWNGLEDYLNYMEERFVEFKRILKKTGSIFVHCDRNASHYLKVILDKVFGIYNFQSEIVWSYKRWSNSKKGLLNAHQIIFFYSKSSEFKFNKILADYSPTTNLDQILQLRKRDGNGKTVYSHDENGETIFADEKKGVPLSDVWEIPFLNPKAKERVNYPTQKPIALLERIIKLTTDEGDKVFDPFCGSGTTLVAAKLLSRDYYGTDISLDAVTLTKQRLDNPIKTESNLMKFGYEKYKRHDVEFENKIKKYNAKIVQRNKGMDGIISSNKYKFIPIKFQKENNPDEDLMLLVTATKKKKLNYCILVINSEFENLVGVRKIEGVIVRIIPDFDSLI